MPEIYAGGLSYEVDRRDPAISIIGKVNGHDRIVEKQKAEALVQPLDWSELSGKAVPEREWHVNEWLGPGPTLLMGRGGIGKSLLAQQLGSALATGTNFISETIRPLNVLYWACEDDTNELHRRQVGICHAMNIDMLDLGRFHVVPRLGQENAVYALSYGVATWTSVFNELKEQAADLDADVVILDNIAHLYGASENDRHQVTSFINGLQGVNPKRPTAQLLMGHPARAVGSEYAGSAAWENAVRMRWYLGASLPDQPAEEVADDTIRFLAKRKANYSGKDTRRFQYINGALVMDEPGPTSSISTYHRKREAERLVIEAMQRFTEMGKSVTDGKTSPSYLPKAILEFKLNGVCTKREITDAMHDLMLANRIRRAPIGTYGNRQEKYGLVIA